MPDPPAGRLTAAVAGAGGRRAPPVSALVFLSGCSALVCQICWLRELRLIFGGSTAATAVVLSIFMGGLGLGAGLLGRGHGEFPGRLPRDRPAREARGAPGRRPRHGRPDHGRVRVRAHAGREPPAAGAVAARGRRARGRPAGARGGRGRLADGGDASAQALLPGVAARLFELLDEPFSVRILDADRAAALLGVASVLGCAHGERALARLEPHVPQAEPLLRYRADCCVERGNPLAARAAGELGLVPAQARGGALSLRAAVGRDLPVTERVQPLEQVPGLREVGREPERLAEVRSGGRAGLAQRRGGPGPQMERELAFRGDGQRLRQVRERAAGSLPARGAIDRGSRGRGRGSPRPAASGSARPRRPRARRCPSRRRCARGSSSPGGDGGDRRRKDERPHQRAARAAAAPPRRQRRRGTRARSTARS